MKVTVRSGLLEFLSTKFNKKKAKSLLKYQQVLVNGRNIRQFDYQLNINDQVEIKERSEIEIIYEDAQIVVINKPAGLLTIGDNHEKTKTAYHLVSQYLKKQNRNNRVFVIHRLDRDTSGLVMFAKSQAVQKAYQDNWNQRVKKREYLAIVEGIPDQKQGTIRNFLQESKTQQVFVAKRGKEAITHYHVLDSNKACSLLTVKLDTGRKNQIRVHMKYLNHPIIGDKKYGAKLNFIGRLGLHSYRLAFTDPFTGELKEFEAPVPEEFNTLFNI